LTCGSIKYPGDRVLAETSKIAWRVELREPIRTYLWYCLLRFKIFLIFDDVQSRSAWIKRRNGGSRMYDNGADDSIIMIPAHPQRWGGCGSRTACRISRGEKSESANIFIKTENIIIRRADGMTTDLKIHIIIIITHTYLTQVRLGYKPT